MLLSSTLTPVYMLPHLVIGTHACVQNLHASPSQAVTITVQPHLLQQTGPHAPVFRCVSLHVLRVMITCTQEKKPFLVRPMVLPDEAYACQHCAGSHCGVAGRATRSWWPCCWATILCLGKPTRPTCPSVSTPILLPTSCATFSGMSPHHTPCHAFCDHAP